MFNLRTHAFLAHCNVRTYDHFSILTLKWFSQKRAHLTPCFILNCHVAVFYFVKYWRNISALSDYAHLLALFRTWKQSTNVHKVVINGYSSHYAYLRWEKKYLRYLFLRILPQRAQCEQCPLITMGTHYMRVCATWKSAHKCAYSEWALKSTLQTRRSSALLRYVV